MRFLASASKVYMKTKKDFLSLISVLLLFGIIITWIIILLEGDLKIVIILNIIFSTLLVLLIITTVFASLLTSKNLEKKYYHYLHFFYVLMPFVMIYLHNFLSIKCSLFFFFALSIVISITIYCIEKRNNYAKLRKLEYSHHLFSCIATILFGIISIFLKTDIDSYTFPLFIGPLLVLEMVYRKLRFEKKSEKKHSAATPM